MLFLLLRQIDSVIKVVPVAVVEGSSPTPYFIQIIIAIIVAAETESAGAVQQGQVENEDAAIHIFNIEKIARCFGQSLFLLVLDIQRDYKMIKVGGYGIVNQAYDPEVVIETADAVFKVEIVEIVAFLDNDPTGVGRRGRLLSSAGPEYKQDRKADEKLGQLCC